MHVAADHPADLLRPFYWVAALGFASGFLGFLAFGAQAVQGG